MKKNFLLASIACFLLSLAAFGQDNGCRLVNGIMLCPSPTPMMTALEELTQLERDAIKNDPLAKPLPPEEQPKLKPPTSEYDKFKNQTHVLSPRMRLLASGKYKTLHDDIHLEADCFYSGRVPTPNNTEYSLSFISYERNWRFLTDHRMIMLLDGKRSDLGNGSHQGDLGDRTVWEAVTFRFSRKALEYLANSGRAELQLGTFETTLSEANKAAIKEIVRTCTTKKLLTK